MSSRKPTLEKISPEFGSSMRVIKHEAYIGEKKPFWHFHPEIELVYVNKGKGKRHIGNHLSYFNNSQLLLLGSNLPHNGFTDRLTVNGSETVVQKTEFYLVLKQKIKSVIKLKNSLKKKTLKKYWCY